MGKDINSVPTRAASAVENRFFFYLSVRFSRFAWTNTNIYIYILVATTLLLETKPKKGVEKGENMMMHQRCDDPIFHTRFHISDSHDFFSYDK